MTQFLRASVLKDGEDIEVELIEQSYSVHHSGAGRGLGAGNEQQVTNNLHRTSPSDLPPLTRSLFPRVSQTAKTAP